MSLEQALAANTAAIVALTAALAASAPQAAPQPQYQAPAAPPQPQYQAPQQPVQQAAPVQQFQAPQQQMPAAPFPQQAAPAPQFQAPAQQQYPFHDNVTAATWAKSVWGQAVAINQEQAMAKFSAMMQALGLVDFDSLTPNHYPALFNGVQQIKAEMGIQG